MLSADDIRRALIALAGELAGSAARCEIAVVGGAALVLLYGARKSTKDVDVVLLDGPGPAPVRAAVRRVADAVGLPDDWLNDAAKGYVHGLALGDVVIDEPGLLVPSAGTPPTGCDEAVGVARRRRRGGCASADRSAGRSRDAVWGLIEPHIVPGRETKAYYAFADLWEALHGPH